MASGPEILQYTRDVTRKFGLDRWIRFNTGLQEAVWDQKSGKWKLKRECCLCIIYRAELTHRGGSGRRGWVV